jgi:hypothetical protein
VAAKVFRADNRVVLTYVPQESDSDELRRDDRGSGREGFATDQREPDVTTDQEPASEPPDAEGLPLTPAGAAVADLSGSTSALTRRTARVPLPHFEALPPVERC